MNWNNNLVGIIKAIGRYEFNFEFKNRNLSDAPMKNDADQCVKMNPIDAVVRKVIVWYEGVHFVTGLKFYDKNNTLLLEVGCFYN